VLLIVVFVLGYLAIVLEAPLRLNKTSAALLMGVVCWTVFVTDGGDVALTNDLLSEHFAGIAQIAFFLLGAMTIVELIDAHDGFLLITSRITTTKRRKLLIIVAALSFVLSAVLDNLTTSIVMISLVRKLASDERDRKILGGIVIVAANAGGVWSPIGDVTTTMLWVGGQATTSGLVKQLVIPALVSVAVPVLWFSVRFRGPVVRPEPEQRNGVATSRAERVIVFATGTGALLGVPMFKTITGLPPVMGILLGLGVLWVVTEFIHKQKSSEARRARSAAAALSRVDSQSVLFFVGILLAIGALESAGTLHALAHRLDVWIGNVDAITVIIGLSSSVVDNVPLVAASQGMYQMTTFPVDHHFWLFLAYCAGTGGSILIVGSAAGIAVMGIQRITFGWYVKHFSFPALLGYFAGALAYLAITAAR